MSNFVFHEVRTAKDKRDVVKEALRVVKKAVYFLFRICFHRKHYMEIWRNLLRF
ncbi:MAG: hypothetical protein ACLUTO_01050 [Anaerostipes sp.]